MVKQHEAWWLAYLRWNTGKHETVRTKMPGMLTDSDMWVMLACLPEPKVTMLPATRLKVGR
jgi:hypothetical protein